MTENGEIIEAATTCLALDQSPHDKQLARRFEAALDGLDRAAAIQMNLAVKLLSGKPYQMITDNAESIERARSIAADLGASIEEYEEAEGVTKVVFKPAAKS